MFDQIKEAARLEQEAEKARQQTALANRKEDHEHQQALTKLQNEKIKTQIEAETNQFVKRLEAEVSQQRQALEADVAKNAEEHTTRRHAKEHEGGCSVM